MQSNNFIPRTTRNRIAMVMGLVSLVLFITWNLYPFQHTFAIYPETPTELGMLQIWPMIFFVLTDIHHIITLDPNIYLVLIQCGLIPLLAFTCIAIFPAWKILQKSKILRIIPAVLFFSGAIALGYSIYLILPDVIPMFFCIMFNYFTTAIALLLFKNESFDASHAI